MTALIVAASVTGTAATVLAALHPHIEAHVTRKRLTEAHRTATERTKP